MHSVVKSTDFVTFRYWNLKKHPFPANIWTLLSRFFNTSNWPLCSTDMTMIGYNDHPFTLFTGVCQRSSMCRYIRDPLLYMAFKCSHVHPCEHRKNIYIWQKLLSNQTGFHFHCDKFVWPTWTCCEICMGNFHPHSKFLIAWIPIEKYCKIEMYCTCNHTIRKDRPCQK